MAAITKVDPAAIEPLSFKIIGVGRVGGGAEAHSHYC